MPRKTAKDREEELRIWESTPVFLTPEGLKNLEEKLARLRRVRPEAVAEVKRTAEYGDRSENDEYKQAKGRLRRIQREIFSIEDQLKKIKIIPSGPGKDGRVQMGSTVVVKSKGKEMTFRIVGPEETDPKSGRISHISPLGAALIGHGKFDTVTFQTGTGIQEYHILEIK